MNKDTYFDKVFAIVREIPVGRVTTYGAIHQFLAEGSARSVGWALNQSLKVQPPVPAHRVVNRKGALSGAKFFGPNSMEKRLQQEGVLVEEGKVRHFENLFWDPEELFTQ
jgi:methylated-DNA-protein-cysteine methyltransferase related protein